MSPCLNRCLPNRRSQVEVTLKFGPEVNFNVIGSLQKGIMENGGKLELSSGASASLISVVMVSPGML